MEITEFKFYFKKYGIKLIYDRIDTAHADMCFSNITSSHSMYHMDISKNFEGLLGSIPNYRKIVLLIFIFQNDKDSIREIGFSERDNNCRNLEFKNYLIEQREEYLSYIKIEEESFQTRLFLNK